MEFMGITFGKNMIDVIAVLLIVVGILYCFYGYRMFDLTLAVLGFIVFSLLVWHLVFGILGWQKIFALPAAFVGGIIGAFLLVALYFVGIFLLGAVFGIMLGFLIMGGSTAAIFLLCGVIGGIFAILFQKFFVIIATSFLGAWGITSGMFHFIPGGFSLDFKKFFYQLGKLQYQSTDFYITLLCWVLLGITGIFIQYKVTGKETSKRIAPGKGSRREK